MNSQSVGPFSQIPTPAQTIPYTQLVPGPMVGSEPQVDYRDGHARIVHPGEGIMVEGELLDCPERDIAMGWVVIQGNQGTVAAGSPALRELMIENSPCYLRLDSIYVRDQDGHGAWDWLAFELSPTGAYIQVSESNSEFLQGGV